MSLNKRRSFFNSVNEQSFTQARSNDDEAEQATHRRENDLETQLSTLSISNKNNTRNDKSNSTLNGASIQNHFQMCLKMYTSNKINTQNAWHLDVFTYMQSLLTSGEKTSSILQVAGSSIEVGAKIYCARIDDTHSEVLKLANYLNKVHIKDNNESMAENNSTDSENENDSEAKNKKKTSRKKKVNKKVLDGENRATIYPSDTALNGTIARLYSKCQESENTNFLDAGKFIKPTFELLTTTEAKSSKWASLGLGTTPKSTMIPNTLFTEPPPTYKICQELSNFHCDLWNADDDDDDLISTIKENFTPMQSGPIEDDYCYEPNATVVSEVETAKNTDNLNGLVFITDMRPGNDINETALTYEYSFRSLPNISENFKVTGAWVGPSRWKLKSVRVNTINKRPDEETVIKKQAKRTSKKCKPLEFVQTSVNEIINILGGANKRIVKKIKSTVDSCTCSEYMEILEERRVTLMTRPKMKIYRSKCEKSSPTLGDNLNITNYDYDNLNDSEYCPAEGAKELDNWEENANSPSAVNEQNNFNQTFANIMEKSMDSDNSPLTYALKAKVMDMKKLKNVVWSEINHIEQKSIEENKEDKNLSFSQIYIKVQNKSPTIMKENLTPSLAFVALLHLANENNILIKNDGNFDDFTTYQQVMKNQTD